MNPTVSDQENRIVIAARDHVAAVASAVGAVAVSDSARSGIQRGKQLVLDVDVGPRSSGAMSVDLPAFV